VLKKMNGHSSLLSAESPKKLRGNCPSDFKARLKTPHYVVYYKYGETVNKGHGKNQKFSIVKALSDRFSDIWKLLSETTLFLSRTGELPTYDDQLRRLRSELQSSKKNNDAIQRIRSEIIELRKQLRLQGHDLSLGKQNLIIDTFRNDACAAEGFQRLVLFIGSENIFYIKGDENHIDLAAFLERHLEKAGAPGKAIRILEKHYLWFCRRGANLVLSGSDTETREDFERLKAIGEANSLMILKGLKGLR
jgi:hypothetical protein